MQLSLKTLVGAGVLALASTSSFAQVVVPPQPADGPFVVGNSGSVIVSVWDAVRGVSIIQHLGLTLDAILPDADMTTNGTLLNFGEIEGFDTVFGASDQANIRYSIVAADSTGSATNAKRIAVSFSGTAESYSILNSAVSGAAGAIQSFANNFLNGASGCNGTNSCIATSSGDGQYAGAQGWGDRFNGQVPVSSAGAIGSVLHFAFAATPNTGSLPPNQAAVTLYQSATGTFGEWLLDTNGNLTYSVSAVPLPAAAWLLLSGLMGMGVVTRRRKDA